MRVFNEEMYFHFIGEVFLYIFFANFSRLSLTAHARKLINLYAGIVYEHDCLCPGWPCARKSFKKVGLVYIHDVPWAVKLAT
jgi:hypothetical protein